MSPAAAPVRVAPPDALPPGGRLVVVHEGVAIVLLEVDGADHALEATCRHRGASLAAGVLAGTRLSCPGHGWVCDVRDGRFAGRDTPRQRTYAVHRRSDGIYLEPR